MASAPIAELAEAHRHAGDCWREARGTWRDAVADAFERDCWTPLDVSTRDLLQAAADLDLLLSTAESDLS